MVTHGDICLGEEPVVHLQLVYFNAKMMTAKTVKEDNIFIFETVSILNDS